MRRAVRAPEREYVDALLADLDAGRAVGAGGRRIETVFFGGGTPSLFAPDSIDAHHRWRARAVPIAPDAEITLEANPGTIEHGRFAGYRAAGVNRVSLGVQSFDDAALARIGRIHGADEARRAAAEVREGGIDNLNLDLMYALPGQDLARRAAPTSRHAVALAPEHLSHYHLTLEPNTLFAAHPPPALPDDDSAWDMQEACQAALAARATRNTRSRPTRDPGACRAQPQLLALRRLPRHRRRRACQAQRGRWRHPPNLEAASSARVPRQRRPALPNRRRRSHRATQLPFEFMLNALRLEGGVAIGALRGAHRAVGAASRGGAGRCRGPRLDHARRRRRHARPARVGA